MNIIKKATAVVSAAVLLLGMAACGSSNGNNVASGKTEGGTSASASDWKKKYGCVDESKYKSLPMFNTSDSPVDANHPAICVLFLEGNEGTMPAIDSGTNQPLGEVKVKTTSDGSTLTITADGKNLTGRDSSNGLTGASIAVYAYGKDGYHSGANNVDISNGESKTIQVKGSTNHFVGHTILYDMWNGQSSVIAIQQKLD